MDGGELNLGMSLWFGDQVIEMFERCNQHLEAASSGGAWCKVDSRGSGTEFES